MKALSSPRRMKTIRSGIFVGISKPLQGSGIPPAVPCPWSASRKMPTAISSPPSPIRGTMAPWGCGSRRWHSWRSWQSWCPAVWGLPSAAQPLAWGNHPDPASARHRRAGGVHRVASLKLGAAAPADVCTGHGALPLVSVEGAAHHRGHYAGRGDPKDPPASAPCGRPAPDCSGSFPPRSLRLALRLRSPFTRLVGRAAWQSCVRAPQRDPMLLVCRIPYLGSVLHARELLHQLLAVQSFEPVTRQQPPQRIRVYQKIETVPYV